MKCKLKTMKVLSYYGSFGYNEAVQTTLTLFVIVFHEIISTFGQVDGYGPAIPGYFHEELPLSWDDLELQLLSKVNGPSLHSNGYHVIKATFPARQSSYIMHISKAQGLFHPDQLGISTTDATNLDCLYSGTVMEAGNAENPRNGIVSLSTCHHEFGFEGLVLLPGEQYYIKPSLDGHHNHNHKTFSKRSAPTTAKPTVSHQAFKVNSPNNPFTNGTHVDEVLHVSQEDLLKATEKQSETNLDHLEDEDIGIGPLTENDENSIEELPLIGDLIDHADDEKSLPPVMAPLSTWGKSKGKKQKSKKSQKKPPKKAASSSGKGQVVEIAVFTDDRLYKTWQSRYPKDTMTKMNQYILAVINNMNALYKQPSFTDSLNFRLVHMEVETTKPKALKDHNGHATKYLKAFCNYAAEKNQYNSLWDHALLLTGHDLQEGGSTATAGIAWFSTMCINGLSCSVIEGSTFGSTFITSHEIGHSLGMEHDGTGPNTGCDENSYIMSPTTGGGKTDWSKCSMKNMKDFISKGYMGNPAPKCINKKGSKAGNPIKFSNTKTPGQQFPASEQCSADCSGCTPYVTTKAPYNDMCHLLFCEQKQNALYSLIRSTHPALEGTSCGSGKVCKLGKCR